MRSSTSTLANPNKGKYARSKQHELRLARALNGRRLPNSGGARRSRWDAARSQGGDIETEDMLIEHKRTLKSVITIKREWMTKVEAGARDLEKLPSLIITFDSVHDEPLDLVVLRVRDLERLTGLQLRPEPKARR
jgi:hypothetical protein